MPTFYNFRESGLDYSFDDIFVPADYFREGNLWTWGNGTNGRLGTNDAINRSTPVTTFAGGSNWKQVSSGDVHTAAIKTDGTLWTWGHGNSGQLGNNSTTNRSTPVTTFVGGNNWRQVNAGGGFAAAIKTDGTLWTWGGATNGILGNGLTAGNRSTPVTTFAGGTNWKQLSCGNSHIAAIKTDGTLWTWGRDINGMLGINALGDRSTPVTTFTGGTNWRQVSCGVFHTGAIKTDGTLWVWGNTSSGRLGNNNILSSASSTPVTTFAGGTNWKQVSCGPSTTAAVKNDGTLWTWGDNGTGQLGDNNSLSKGTPITTFAGGTNWKNVYISTSDFSISNSVSAIKTDGTLWVWGNNANLKLGTNDTINRSTPVTTFAGGTKWKETSGGTSSIAALTYIDRLLPP